MRLLNSRDATRRWAASLLALLCVAPACVAQPDLADADAIGLRVTQAQARPTPVAVRRLLIEPQELSGIAWDGRCWLAVSDENHWVFEVEAPLDDTGGVAVATAVDHHPIEGFPGIDGVPPAPTPLDIEDIAWCGDGRALVVEERGVVWAAEDETDTGKWDPAVSFSLGLDRDQLDPDRGYESLAFRAGVLATCTEEALRADGGRSTFTRGTLVRIVRVNWPTDNQREVFPYRTDAINGDMPGTDLERSGVVALEFLTEDASDDRLLVLERAAGLTGLRARLYLVDLDEVREDAETPLTKHLLWQRTSRRRHENYEGMSLGPALADGRRVLMLVADNGGNGPNVVLPLVVEVVGDGE